MRQDQHSQDPYGGPEQELDSRDDFRQSIDEPVRGGALAGGLWLRRMVSHEI
jgi:hypothetical protein